MRIAIFSDVHANLPAVEAVLADIDAAEPDLVFCLGDLVGYAPWPDEVVAEIRRPGLRPYAQAVLEAAAHPRRRKGSPRGQRRLRRHPEGQRPAVVLDAPQGPGAAELYGPGGTPGELSSRRLWRGAGGPGDRGKPAPGCLRPRFPRRPIRVPGARGEATVADGPPCLHRGRSQGALRRGCILTNRERLGHQICRLDPHRGPRPGFRRDGGEPLAPRARRPHGAFCGAEPGPRPRGRRARLLGNLPPLLLPPHGALRPAHGRCRRTGSRAARADPTPRADLPHRARSPGARPPSSGLIPPPRRISPCRPRPTCG